MFFAAFEPQAPVAFGDYSKPKQKVKQYKQKTSPQSYKTQIKIIA